MQKQGELLLELQYSYSGFFKYVIKGNCLYDKLIMPINAVGLLLFTPLYIGGLYLKSKRSYGAALLHYNSMTLKNSGILDDIGT
jgi:hypothetical protein